MRALGRGRQSSFHEDISGRPVLFQLYSSIKTGLVKHLWVYDQSRLSRNDQVASVFRYECNKQGVTLYTKDGQFDLSSPQDKFLKQLLDAVAEFDNTTRAERTRLGKLQRVNSGSWHGGPPPFGYRLEGKKLVVENAEAKWVKKIFKLSLDGAASPEIKSCWIQMASMLGAVGSGRWAQFRRCYGIRITPVTTSTPTAKRGSRYQSRVP
ncbi:recombinase family protein [Candidatus Skiveiella danica]|uniref:recombinase family protein n=1 Tax=Candidatus Skiveiella danica TaxID=3386177 RepID=UPI0039B940F6